jgi:hypothetical protein
LVEAFPIVGHSIHVKRYDGSLLNPWLTEVKYVAQQNKIIDSLFLVNKNFSVQLQAGGEKTEDINAILPLYSIND